MNKLKQNPRKRYRFIVTMSAVTALCLLLAPMLATHLSGSRDCYASWAETEIEKMVDEVLRKRGGLPRGSSSFVVAPHGTYPPFSDKETEAILKWRVNRTSTLNLYDSSSNLYIELDELIEPEYRIWSVVDVLYADGTWLEVDWHHGRYGYVSFCFLPSFGSAEHFNAAVAYDAIETDSPLQTISEDVLNFDEDGSWHYKIQKKSNEDWRIITIQVDDLSSPETVSDFAAYNQSLGEQLRTQYSELDVQVVFNEPLSQSMVEDIFDEHDFSSVTVYIQSLNMNNDVVTWPLELGDKSNRLDKELEFSERFNSDKDQIMPVDTSQLTVLGISSIVGRISADTHERLLERNDVLMLDVTPTLLREKVLEQTGKPISDKDIVGVAPIMHLGAEK